MEHINQRCKCRLSPNKYVSLTVNKNVLVLLILLVFILNCVYALDSSVEASVLLPVPDNSEEMGFADSISNAKSGFAEVTVSVGSDMSGKRKVSYQSTIKLIVSAT